MWKSIGKVWNTLLDVWPLKVHLHLLVLESSFHCHVTVTLTYSVFCQLSDPYILKQPQPNLTLTLTFTSLLVFKVTVLFSL